MRRGIAGALVALAACGGADAPGHEQEPGNTVPPDVVSSLNVQLDGDPVRFRLDVSNGADTPITFEFPSAQRYDFAVLDGDGAEVWRWSADMGFAQMLGTETLAPGETRSWDVAWPATGRSGTFTVVAQLTSTSQPLEMRTEFEIPVR